MMNITDHDKLSRPLIKSMSWIQSRKDKARHKRHEADELHRMTALYRETKIALEKKTQQFSELEWSIWSSLNNDNARLKTYAVENEHLREQIRQLEEKNWQYEVYIFNHSAMKQSHTSTEVASDETSTEVASDETSTEVASNETSTEVASNETSTVVASNETSTEVASSDTSTEVASSETSTVVASNETSTEVASNQTSTEVASNQTSTVSN